MIMLLGYFGNYYNCFVFMLYLEGIFFLFFEINFEIISLCGKNVYCK